MRLSIYSLYMLCALVLVFSGQAMAGEWTDEFEDEDQMAEGIRGILASLES